MNLISVIIPLYKGEQYIEKLLDNLSRCCLNKSADNEYKLEVIFVNDEPLTEINIDDYGEREYEISLLQNEHNYGIHYSRVRGLRQAKGDYILFLDQDDCIDDRYFVSQLEHIEDHNVVICNGKYRNDREIIYNENEAMRIADLEDYFTTLNGIVSPGQALIRKRCIPDVWQKYILSENYCDDAFLWMLLKDRGEIFCINRDLLYYHYENGENTSFRWKHAADALEEMYEIIEKNTLLTERNMLLLKKCIYERIQKYMQYYTLEQKIQDMVSHKENVRNYLKKNDINTLAVYGYGVYGKKLLECLEECNIRVEYVIDKNANAFIQDSRSLKTMEDELDNVDMIIVTPLFAYRQITEELNKKIKTKFIALDMFCDEVINYN